MKIRSLVLALGFLLVGLFGYWLADSAVVKSPPRPPADPNAEPKRLVVDDDSQPKFRRGERTSVYRRDEEAAANGALQGQRVLVFSDRESLEEFLKRAGDRVRVMGRLDALNALRLAFLDYDDLASLLDGSQQESLVFPVDVPTIGEGTAQANAVGLGAGLLDWLGITVDNSAWGRGVRIAILDTGVTSSRSFATSISGINLVELPGDPSAQNGHGTAVASMIIGNSSLTPGVAPGADILSIRIANDLGQSDSFLLAQGIVAAADGGAQLINISMGSYGDSAVVKNAIAYAQATGALVIAAAGNNGTDRVTYPAANSGVIAVGAVDAAGNHLDFSNTGSQVSISAPGFLVNAAWTEDQAARVSGTSFSAPIVAGVIAAVKSWPGNEKLTTRQAADIVYSYLNDSGAAGVDSSVGAGTPDLGRILNGKTPGIYDAAVASQRIIPATNGSSNGLLEVLVQNRGTETLVNTSVQINTPGGTVQSNISTLPPGGVQAVRVPAGGNTADSGYVSNVSLSGGKRDAKPSNDRRVETYVPPVSK